MDEHTDLQDLSGNITLGKMKEAMLKLHAEDTNNFLTNPAGLKCGVSIVKDLQGRCKIALTPTTIKNFNSGEIFVQVQDNQRKKNTHVFVQFRNPNVDKISKFIKNSDLSVEDKFELLTTIRSPNTGLKQLELLGDALKRSGVKQVDLYLPYIPYQRQDKKDDGRVPISAKLIFDKLQVSYGSILKGIATADLHSRQAQGFFQGQLDEVFPSSLYASLIKSMHPNTKEIVIVSPDAGGVKRARYLAKLLDTKYAILDKERISHGQSKSGFVIGDVKDKTAWLIDDIADTGGSLAAAPKILHDAGAKEQVYAIATHGELSPKIKDEKIVYAEDTLRDAGIHLFITDSIPRSKEWLEDNKDWCSMLSVMPYFADYAHCNIAGKSATNLIRSYEKDALNGTFDLERFDHYRS